MNIHALLLDICDPATEPTAAESSETNNGGVTRKKRSLLPRGCNRLTVDPFYCYIISNIFEIISNMRFNY